MIFLGMRGYTMFRFFLLASLFAFTFPSQAQLNSMNRGGPSRDCSREARDNIRDCQEETDDAQAAEQALNLGAQAQVGSEGNMNPGAQALNQSASKALSAWKQASSRCSNYIQRCEDACTNVMNGRNSNSDAEKRKAQENRQKCRDEIGANQDRIYGKIDTLGGAVRGSAATGGVTLGTGF